MPDDFTWVDAERTIRFGRDSVGEAPGLLAEQGFGDFALLTTERARKAAPGVVRAAATELLVPAGGVPEAAATVRGDVGGRPLVALGGGRVIDAAKAIAGADGLVCAAIPTTLSGAELTRIHRMPAGVQEFTLVRPRLVVADPDLMASQPLPALAASAMNALAHGFEALYVPLRNPVADAAALEAAERIGRGLGTRMPDRGELALGSLLAAYALGATGLAVHHVICQTLVRLAGTPHAETNAVMLPHTLALMERRVPDVVERFRSRLGADPMRLAAEAGCPTSLAALGADRAVIGAVVEGVLARPQLANTPDPPGPADLEAVLEAAFREG